MDAYFSKKVASIINDCYSKDKTYIFPFLSLSEQDLVSQEVKKYPSLILKFDGGMINSEYKRAIIMPYEMEVNNNISILKISYNKKYLNLTHRIVLGTLMHLGLSRDRVGDIMITDQYAYVAVIDSIRDFIIENLTSISNQSVLITVCDEVIELDDKGEEKTIFISSNRLDAIISQSYNISRDESSTLIEKELVKVNQKIVTKSFQNLNPCDIISVAHKGRVKILETNGLSRSGRIILKVKIYR